ncbi:MAG: DUF177 domain-containing protein [Bacteriovoracaceae bacterium]|nr:DUF177 domain-containing protein [Bacteriovoracaceae bacterium]
MPTPPEILSLARYNLGQTYFLDFAADHPAMQALQAELEENITPEALPEIPSRAITAQVQVTKRFQDLYQTYVIVQGEIKATYAAQCVRCLETFAQPLQTSFKACFLPAALEKEEEFQDLTDILIDQEECALYFYTQNKLNLAELMHEQLFLAVPAFPLHDPHCLGLCPQCGANRNRESCPHGPKGV